MELHGKDLLSILGKPLDMVSKFVLNLGQGGSLESHRGSHEGRYKPSPSTLSSITSNPLIFTFLLLFAALLLLFSSPVQQWLITAKNLPTLAQIFGFSREKKPPPLPKESEGVNVWASKRSGYYYCQGGALWGDRPGEEMGQAKALMSGYQPLGGEYCSGNQPVVASTDSSSPDSQEPADSSGGPSNAVESSVQASIMNQPETLLAGESVKVWAKLKSGLYYCSGDVLFGEKPGKLMSQSDALVAGYLPFGRNCDNVRTGQASADNLSPDHSPRSAPRNNLPPAEKSLAVTGKQPAELSKAGKHVSVWAIKEFGFYYCRGDVLFGHKPGRLMMQDDALTAGYQPSDGTCSNNKRTNTSAERLSPGVLPDRR